MQDAYKMSRSIYHHMTTLCVLYSLTFTVVVPIVCYFLPYSQLFRTFHSQDEMLSRAIKLNKDRTDKAIAYFKSIDKTKSTEFYAQHDKGPLDLLVVIITVKRKSTDHEMPRYLLQSAAAMDELLKNDRSFERKKLVICNVDNHPLNHTDAEFLTSLIPQIQRYSSNKTALPPRTPYKSQRVELYKRFHHINKYEKETIDYMFCLESAFLTRSSYILLMEDDAVPYSDVLPNIKHALDSKLDHHNRRFGHIKLYYPEKWQGYAFEMTRILELLSVGCVGGGCFVLLFTWNLSGRGTAYFIQIIYFITGCVYFILVAEMLGRQNVMELRRISASFFSFKSSPGCCTQAMLYSKSIVPSLLDHLQGSADPGSDHTDIAIYKFTTQNAIPAYQIEPNLFHHVGLYTSLEDGKYKDPEGFLFHV